MIQRITKDDEGNTVIELDREGIAFLMDGLKQLDEGEVGSLLTTPAIWVNDAGDPVVGEFKLRRVA